MPRFLGFMPLRNRLAINTRKTIEPIFMVSTPWLKLSHCPFFSIAQETADDPQLRHSTHQEQTEMVCLRHVGKHTGTATQNNPLPPPLLVSPTQRHRPVPGSGRSRRTNRSSTQPPPTPRFFIRSLRWCPSAEETIVPKALRFHSAR